MTERRRSEVSQAALGFKSPEPTRTIPLPIPYEGTQALVIDEAALDADYDTEIEWVSANLQEEEAGRVLTAAAALYAAEAGTIAECLRTATIWERG